MNFNNIFSTESISPMSFYAKRGFGNKRFYTVPANNNDACIVLFTKFPKFVVDNSDLENYPMVIEIDTEDYTEGKFKKVLESNGVCTYACTDTIYLNPFHSFLYFNSYEERQSVLTKAEQSLENKFYRLYKSNLKIKSIQQESWFTNAVNFFTQAAKDEFSWSSQYNEFTLEGNTSNIETDILIDRIKGFIYCYLIGCNRSITPETAKLKSIAKNLKNVLSAVINSPEKKPNSTQDAALLHGIKEFNKIYSLKDDTSQSNQLKLQNRLKANPLGLSCEDCIKLLESLNLFDVFCSNLHLNKAYDAGELWTCLESLNTDQSFTAIENLEAAVKRIEISDLSSSASYHLKDLINIDSSFNVIIKDTSYNSCFYQHLIKSHIKGDYLKIMQENGVGESLAQAYNGGTILRTLMGDKWTDSKASLYINNLLQYFQENSSFDISSINNEVLSSFAAFCQKGDNIDRLSDYLIQCGFTNYRLAFGLYGATRGFASLPKTFTKSLINGDKEYLKSFYVEVYILLFHVKLTETNFPEFEDGLNNGCSQNHEIYESLINKTGTKGFESDSMELNHYATNIHDDFNLFLSIFSILPGIKKSKAYKILTSTNSHNSDAGNLSSLKELIYSIVGKQLNKSVRFKIERVIELVQFREDPESYIRVLSELVKPSEPLYRKIVSCLSPSLLDKDDFAEEKGSDSVKNETIKPSYKPLYKTSNLFVEDINASNFILTCKYLPHSLKDILRKKIEEFQSDYAPGGYYFSKSENPRTNSNTVKHFINRCTFQKEKVQPWIYPSDENKHLLELLKRDMLERYVD